MLRGWTLHTAGEAPFEVRPTDHDPAHRDTLDPGTDLVLLSLSTPLGIEALPPDEAQPLLDAWHAGLPDLPARFAGWAAVSETEPDLDGLAGLFTSRFVGVQVSAATLATPDAVAAAGPLLRRCEELNRPVLVHPGSVAARATSVPKWWAAVVDYSAQLQAAWWAWHVAGRRLLPSLRMCFVAGAGLAALQHERFTARGGGRFVVDDGAFVDTSSHGRQAVDALTRVLGIDVIVLGSDRPYAEPGDAHLGAAADHAVRVVNPYRLLRGGTG